MTNIMTIFRREFKHYFTSPIAYIFMILFLGLMSFVFFFFFHFFLTNDTSMRRYFETLPWFFTVFTAAISMRLWSEEKKLGTLELLLTMPVKSWELVIGKYLAGLSILFITIVFTFSIPVTLAVVGDPDWGKITTGYLGTFFAGALLMALGSWISAMTENQTVSLMVTSVAGVLLLAMGITYVSGEINNLFGGWEVGTFLGYFSLLEHMDGMIRGILDFRDVIYFVSFTALLLLLNYIAVENRKY